MDATEPATTRNIASCSTNIEAASCCALIVLVIREALDLVSPGVPMSRGAKRVAGTTTQSCVPAATVISVTASGVRWPGRSTTTALVSLLQAAATVSASVPDVNTTSAVPSVSR